MLEKHSTERATGEKPVSSARSALAGLGFVAASYGAAAIGMLASRGKGRPGGAWYRGLRKASFQPPDRVFGPAWTVLYATIAYSGWRIWRSRNSRARTRALGLWFTQLALNGAWSPLFFGARKPAVALADQIALDAAAGLYAVAAARVDRQAAAVVVPYLGWLGFATALNAVIVAKNR